MEMTGQPRVRFQYSLRTLFVVTAIVALLLVPVGWVARERQRMLEAREAALRAVVLAERDRAVAVEARYKAAVNAQTNSALSPAAGLSGESGDNPPGNIAGQAEKAPMNRAAMVEQLMRENAELKKTVEQLHREIERLKAAKG